MNDESAEYERRRRAILRKANLYMWGFLGAGLLVAIGGSAMVAWLFTRGGRWPFVETWVALTALVLLPTGIGLVVRAVRERIRSNDGARLHSNEDDPEQWPTTER